MYKLFTLRVRSGDIYFSIWEVLTLNVKNYEDLKKTLTGKHVPNVLYQVCFVRTDQDKISSRAGYDRSREYPFPKNNDIHRWITVLPIEEKYPKQEKVQF